MRIHINSDFGRAQPFSTEASAHLSVTNSVGAAEGSKAKVADAIPLLQLLWRTPSAAHFLGLRDPKNKQFKNLPTHGPVGAAALAGRHFRHGLDVYLACAEFHQPNCRTESNACGAWALWMDIDCGPAKAAGGSGYLNVSEAREALDIFCRTTQLPSPNVLINSGTGLHVYWVLDEFMPAAEWKHMARKLKALAAAKGLKADPSRTADIASVMRLPGTWNWKYGKPLPVEVIYSSGNCTSASACSAAIEIAHAAACGAGPIQKRPMQPRLQLKEGTHRLLEFCLSKLDPDMGRDEWFRVAAVIFNETSGSDEGFELFHSWSRQGEKYAGNSDVRSLWRSLKPDHPKPLRMGTLRCMLEDRGHDWMNLCLEADGDVFAMTTTEVL